MFRYKYIGTNDPHKMYNIDGGSYLSYKSPVPFNHICITLEIM